ncbi:MAG: hypothetical protein KAS32_15540 [Candidatus Peribacteraceae bacterium]|nr:hypothetical protein [Candidatus Peribacteraceae bacterium]
MEKTKKYKELRKQYKDAEKKHKIESDAFYDLQHKLRDAADKLTFDVLLESGLLSKITYRLEVTDYGNFRLVVNTNLKKNVKLINKIARIISWDSYMGNHWSYNLDKKVRLLVNDWDVEVVFDSTTAAYKFMKKYGIKVNIKPVVDKIKETTENLKTLNQLRKQLENNEEK